MLDLGIQSLLEEGAQSSDHPGILGGEDGGHFPAPGQCCALVCIPEKVFPSVTWTVDECGARGETGGPGNRQGWKEPGLGESGLGGKLGKGCDIIRESVKESNPWTCLPSKGESQSTDTGSWWQKVQFTVKAPDKSPGAA